MAHIRLVEGASDTDAFGVQHKRNVLFSESNEERINHFRANPRYEVVESAAQFAGRVPVRKSRHEQARAANRKAAAEAEAKLAAPEAPKPKKSEDVSPAKKLTVKDFKVSPDRLVALSTMTVTDALRKDALIAIATDLLADVTPEDTKRTLVGKIAVQQALAGDALALAGNVSSQDDAEVEHEVDAAEGADSDEE